MQTSNCIKRILKWFAAIAAAVLINWMICFILVPYGSKSEIMWTDYRQTQGIDTVYLGTSLVERSVNPNIIDEELGTNSFNMATPSQSLEDTYLGIEQAIKDHDIKRAVVGVEFADLNRKSDKKTGVFVAEKTKGETPLEALHDWTVSIDCDTWLWDSQAFSMLLFPWQIQHVGVRKIASNVIMKLDGTSIYEAAEKNEPGWNYVGKGFGGCNGEYKYIVRPDAYYVNYGMLKDATEFAEDRMQVVERICNLCTENDVELIFFVNPLSDFNIISFGDNYQMLSDGLKGFVEERGAAYFDFNFARPELFESKDSYYEDSQHMNFDGANALSASIAKLLGMLDAGEEVDELFGTYADRCERVDGLASACLMPVMSTGDAIEMHAVSVAGPDVEVEYRFSVKDDINGDDYVVVQDWSSSSDYIYVPSTKSRYKCKLEVRDKDGKGHKVETIQTIMF